MNKVDMRAGSSVKKCPQRILPGWPTVRKTCIPVVLIILYTLCFTGSNSFLQKAYGDGLTEEMFGASIQGRSTQLLVKVNPPVITNASRDDSFFLLRLYDVNTNQTISYTTFSVTIEKGLGKDSETLMPSTLFHSENGLLKLKVQPLEDDLQIIGTQDQFLHAWLAAPNGTINIRGPIFLEGGIYHLRIEILGVDDIRNTFSEDEIVKFDFWLSVGDVLTKSIEYQGLQYNATIISYYDSVQDLNFDASKQQFTWVMPFDWNVTRLQSTNLFVHEELKIPKSLAGVGDAMLFAATVNGNRISGRMLAVDPYSSENELTLHFLLSKDDILKLAEGMKEEDASMTFTLAPAAASVAQTTEEMVTDAGGINIALKWSPDQLSGASNSMLTLNFSDAFSGDMINSDIIYDLKILDKDGKNVYSKTDLTAAGGTDTRTINFPRDDNYQIEVVVKGLTQDGQSIDKTRAGVARGAVIVPEFPVWFMNVAVVLTMLAVVLSRKFYGR